MIGVFGGTFDPIHFGHLRSALEIAERFDLTVHMIPAGDPPHRAPPHANAAQRLAMLEIALRGQSRLLADDREVRRDGRSYMVDTLAEMAEELAAPLALILGHDAFVDLPSWHRWRRLFDLANIIVIERPRANREFDSALQRQVERRRVAGRLSACSGQVTFCRLTQLEISASAIRQLLAQKRLPNYLMPAAVLDYIRAQQLYSDEASR